MRTPIISVTGTKGKTTTVAIIADVLQKMDKNVLKVDTTGHFINGKRKSTLEDAKKTWRLVPTVSPGRYLWEFYANPSLANDGVAVLECALGSSSSSGLGYRNHNVGVFLNVFEDHLGSSKRLTSKEDIANAKGFIFSRLDRDNAYAVFNADDELVCKKLDLLPKSGGTKLIACGVEFKYFDIKTHLREGGLGLTIINNKAVLLQDDKKIELFDFEKIPFTFGGKFMPSVFNLLHAAGAVIGYSGGKIADNFAENFESVQLDPYGGRLTILKAGNGTTILADYAHEKISLIEVAHLAKSLVTGSGKVIGVVRLAKDRTDQLVKETGLAIANEFDQFIVYDKIDGYLRKPQITTGDFPEVVGRISDLFSKAIMLNNKKVERILREDKAIARATELAGPNDVVVVIVNDNIEQSLSFIKKSFMAEFV